jgi:hypothetical protein
MKTTNYEISKQLAEINGINRKTFAARIRKGWDIKEAAMKPLFKKSDLTGQRFGRLVVINFAGQDKRYNDKYLCQCDCGNQTTVYKHSLLAGTKSCRCLAKEISTTHGVSKTRIYNIWQSMKQRCLDKNCNTFGRYGGRGINVCDRWIESFDNFLKDMGQLPTPNHSIDRIDNNGNYEPSNCRWATVEQQARNRRSNRRIFYKNQELILVEWCEKLAIPYKTTLGRILSGWNPERAFETPIRKTK